MFSFTRFEELLREKGVKKTFLAEKLHRTSTIFQDWKAGKSRPSYEQVQIVAEALGTTPEYLTGETDEKKPVTNDEQAEKLAKMLSKDALEIARMFEHANPMLQNIIKSILNSEPVPEEKKQTKIIPLFGQRYAAGVPEPSGDMFSQDYETEDMRAEFAIHVNGDSMEPYLHDGSIALGVKRYPNDGEVGAFFLDGGFLVKQCCVDSQSNVYLFALNRDRKEADDIVWANSGRDLRVVGTILMDKKIPLPE